MDKSKHVPIATCVKFKIIIAIWIMERRRSSGFCRILTVAFDRLFLVR